MAKLKTGLSGKDANIRVEREYAKSIGVKSPTTLSKAQLDEAVRRREIELGIIRERYNLYDYAPFERESLASQADTRLRAQLFTGYYKPFPEGDGVLRRDPFANTPESDAYVAKSIAEKYDLRLGDKVLADVVRAECNRIRVVKKFRHINDRPASKEMMRYDEMMRIDPTAPFKILGNNALIGVIQDVLDLRGGQSRLVSGCENNEALSESIAELIKAFYNSYNGEVFCIIEGLSQPAKEIISSVINPESMIIDGDRDEYPIVMETAKRAVENGTPATVVIYAPSFDATELIKSAGAVDSASLTVIAFAQGKTYDILLPFNRDKISVDLIKSTNSESIKELSDGTTDEILTAYTELDL